MKRAPSRKRATLADVAAHCGVSGSTVSRVLSNCRTGFSVRDPVRARILQAVAEMDYRPSVVASSLKARRTRIVVIMGFTAQFKRGSSIYTGLINRTVSLLMSEGYQVVSTFPDPQRGVCAMLPWRVDGVLVVLSTGDQPLDEVEKAGIPYLAINGHAGPHGTTLLLDEDDAVRQVMAYLVGLGHRRIAYRNTPLSPSHYSVTARHRAYLAACTAHGLTPAPGHDRLPAADADFLRQARADGATAVLAYSHVEAMALLFAAAKAGLRIPTDMSLAAFNDVYPVAEIVPSLTVMAQPLDEMGDTAGRLLVDMMKHDRRDPRCIEFKQSLIVRQSTAAPAPRRPHDDA